MVQDRPLGLGRGLTEYGDREFARFLRNSFARSMGYSSEALGKPVVGIVNTFSELNNCHRHFRELAEAVKRGVWQAGGIPLEFPVISLGEVFVHPTSMMFRNLMSMDVEEMLRAQPVDSAVLMGGCDKTMPALLMGAASAGVPSIALAAGPMLSGSVRGERVGACTDCRLYWGRYRRGEIDRAVVDAAERQLAPTAGTCGVMGTASTMACLAEALGMMLPGGASIPAVAAERLQHAEATGKQAVTLARSGIAPADVLTGAAFHNAIVALQAIGGSTNAVIHLTAIAGRLGLRLELTELDALSDGTPVLVDMKPSGRGYMEDFHRAGGMPVVLSQLRTLLRLEAVTVTGEAIGDVVGTGADFPSWQDVVRRFDDPLQEQGALVAVHGSLAPDGAILKRSAARPDLLNTTGRAVVFTSLADLDARIDDPALDVRADDFLVLQGGGPLGAPGMPEAGYLPIPKKLAGVTDMVRISDARMSGTGLGTVILHVSPEAAAGGPLGLVRDGDKIALSVDERRLDLLVSQNELARRRAARSPAPSAAARGYEALYRRAVQQAHLGADFDFLRHETLRDS